MNFEVDDGNVPSGLALTLARPASIKGMINADKEPHPRALVLIPYGSQNANDSVLVQDLGRTGGSFVFDGLPDGTFHALVRRLDGEDSPWRPQADEVMTRINLPPGTRHYLQLPAQ